MAWVGRTGKSIWAGEGKGTRMVGEGRNAWRDGGGEGVGGGRGGEGRGQGPLMCARCLHSALSPGLLCFGLVPPHRVAPRAAGAGEAWSPLQALSWCPVVGRRWATQASPARCPAVGHSRPGHPGPWSLRTRAVSQTSSWCTQTSACCCAPVWWGGGCEGARGAGRCYDVYVTVLCVEAHGR
jgi:hypothetical protein